MPGAFDGTPLTADWGNDVEGFKQAVLSESGITPSGDPDTAEDSQILDGLKLILTSTVDDILSANATNLPDGVITSYSIHYTKLYEVIQLPVCSAKANISVFVPDMRTT